MTSTIVEKPTFSWGAMIWSKSQRNKEEINLAAPNTHFFLGLYYCMPSAKSVWEWLTWIKGMNFMSNLAVMTPILRNWVTSLIIRNLKTHLSTIFNLPLLSISGFQPHARLDIGFRLTTDSSYQVSVYTFFKKCSWGKDCLFVRGCQAINPNVPHDFADYDCGARCLICGWKLFEACW